MTACIHHGNPGSYKSFGVIQRVVIPALKKGRVLVTNIRGLDSLSKIEDAIGEKLHSDSQIIYVEADSAKGFQAMSHFFHWAPKGALIVMDEFQRIYSKKRDRDLKKYDLHINDSSGAPLPDETVRQQCPWWDGDRDRPETVENAFDQHRHYNWDIYGTTPNIAKVHPEAREVAEVAYRHKALGAILPWKKHSWKEFAHDPESSGKQLSHYMGSPKEYKADPRIFACYQSTKTGKAVGSSESRPIYRDPKLQMVTLGIIGCFFWFTYSAVQAFENGSFVGLAAENALPDTPAPVPQVDSSGTGHAPGVVPAPSGPQASISVVESADPFQALIDAGAQPYVSAVVYVRSTGAVYYRVHVYFDDQLLDVFDQDALEELGYLAQYRKSGLLLNKHGNTILLREYYGSAGTRREEPMGGAEGARAAPVPTIL